MSAQSLFDVVKSQNVAELVSRLEAGADPRVTDGKRGNLLIEAVQLPNAKMLSALLQTAAREFVGAESSGMTLLDLAFAVRAPLDIVQALLDAGAPTREAPLTTAHSAACHPDPRVLELVLERTGVDVNARCSRGVSLVDYAAGAGVLESVRWLLARGARVAVDPGAAQPRQSAISHACYNEDPSVSDSTLAEIVRVLAAAGCPLQSTDGDCSNLHIAVIARRPRVAETLVQLGVQLDQLEDQSLIEDAAEIGASLFG